MVRSNRSLVDEIRRTARLYLGTRPRSQQVLDALLQVDRALFVPAEAGLEAYEDVPVSLGWGQTCSQPSMVAFMLDELEIRDGDRILEIGAGSGYAAAVASRLCGTRGRVFACEIVPELAASTQRRLEGWPNVDVITGDASAGLPREAPFDRIFLSAGVASDRFDRAVLLAQLDEEGILLYPQAHGNLYKLKKTGSVVSETSYWGVSFVPLKGENS